MKQENDIPTFTILLVDDHPDSVKSNIKRIKNLLKRYNHKLEVIENKNGKRVTDILSSIAVDVVAIDYNLKTGTGGLEVIKEIRSSDHLVDILFYSAKKNIPEVWNKAGHFSFTEVVRGRKIASRLEKLVKKSLAKWKDIFFLRGFVISKIIDLEMKMGDFLEQYYKLAKNRDGNFRHLVIENKFFSFEGKKSAIINIIDKEKIDIKISTKLQDLQNYRNDLAHCKTSDDDPNILISMGNRKPIGRKEMLEIFYKINEVSEKLDILMEKL